MGIAKILASLAALFPLVPLLFWPLCLRCKHRKRCVHVQGSQRHACLHKSKNLHFLELHCNAWRCTRKQAMMLPYPSKSCVSGKTPQRSLSNNAKLTHIQAFKDLCTCENAECSLIAPLLLEGKRDAPCCKRVSQDCSMQRLGPSDQRLWTWRPSKLPRKKLPWPCHQPEVRTWLCAMCVTLKTKKACSFWF